MVKRGPVTERQKQTLVKLRKMSVTREDHKHVGLREKASDDKEGAERSSEETAGPSKTTSGGQDAETGEKMATLSVVIPGRSHEQVEF